MSAIEHNAKAVKELLEVVEMYQSGLLADEELLCRAEIIGKSVQFPVAGSVDPNTGLSYPKR